MKLQFARYFDNMDYILVSVRCPDGEDWYITGVTDRSQENISLNYM